MNTTSELVSAYRARLMLGGISDRTLYRWMRSKEFEFPLPVVMNRRRFFKRMDLINFIEKQQQV